MGTKPARGRSEARAGMSHLDIDHDGLTFFYGAASGSSRKALQKCEASNVMINYATQNNQPWDGIDCLFIDSGGYSFMLGKGEYGTTDTEYTRFINDVSPDLWALRDYPCEPDVLDTHDRSVRGHQRRTTERHASLLNEAGDGTPGEPVSVVQGWRRDQYVRHVDELRDRGCLTDYVGIGSVCRRHAEAEIREIVTAVTDALPERCSVHAFGVKASVLSTRGVPERIDSCDSLAYEYQTRRNHDSNNWINQMYELVRFRDRMHRHLDNTDSEQTTLAANR